MSHITRRNALAGFAGIAAATAVQAEAGREGPAASPPAQSDKNLYPAQTRWIAPPPIKPAHEGLADLPGIELWHQDMGGSGVPVVLLHANTGCYASWVYQQGALSAVGFRAITYSARGHYRSGAIAPANPGTSTADLAALLDYLKISQAHIVGTAAGGLAALDYALSHPERVLSVTISSSHMGIVDPEFVEVGRQMVPKGVYGAWRTFSELGPSYRAANPAGVAAWEALEKVAWQGGTVRQKTETPNSFARIAGISVPALFITGDADPIMPPARMREVAARAPGSEIVTVAEAGHSLAWEQPEAFNSALLDFMGRHDPSPRKASQSSNPSS